jgi:pre-rRNA-processing protein RIX1
MAFVALPPELRSLCRKLTSTKPEQLPNLLPALLKDVQRCQGPLSEPQDSKSSANSSEAAVLVHKLRKQITTLLNGRSVEGRFAATALVKAAIEAGGWECLRMSEPWVQGLLSILQVSQAWTLNHAITMANDSQKRDPLVTKELCIVTLTKIYILLHKYPTLIREITTPTLPSFATVCLQILKPTNQGKVVSVPMNFTETVFEAFSTLIPLYPTTLRPFATRIRSATRPCLAPTTSDGAFVPASLQGSSRRLIVRLHMAAVKNGGSDEWTKHVAGLIKDFHQTADQVLRAIEENWESTTGYMRQQVDFEKEPHGGSSSPDHLPQWTGVQAGSERMTGLLSYIADSLRCGTKIPVTVPTSAIADMVARVSSIMPPVAGKDKLETVQMNPAAGREEKDELWSVFPDIQVAAMQLMQAVINRLGRNHMRFAQETLDQVLRMFQSGYRLPELRAASFSLVTDMLRLCGPTMTKQNVDTLDLVAKSCCHDLLGSAGQLKVPKQQASLALQNGSKSKTVTHNADSFLASNAEEDTLSVNIDSKHASVAEKLLVTMFSHLPQQHINAALRSRMLQTAVLCHIKDAQVASVLHPSRGKGGRAPQVILPYLHRQFPHDETVEVLRFNFRPTVRAAQGDFMDMEDDDMDLDDEIPAAKPSNGFTFDRPFETTLAAPQNNSVVDEVITKTASLLPTTEAEAKPSPFLVEPHLTPENPLKRKSEETEAAISKRLEVEAVEATIKDPGSSSVGALVESSLGKVGQADEDDSDDESVHLNMDLDSDVEGEE